VLHWYCLFFGSYMVVWICILYSNVKGTLPTAAMWLEGIAAVVMTVGCFGYICAIITKSPNENEVRGLEESLNELQQCPSRPDLG
jgi:hypothetical protein